MVDIIIGAAPVARVTENPVKTALIRSSFIDAKILDIRPARKGRKETDTPDKRKKAAYINTDPSGSTVIVLMIKDTANLPDDLKSGNYQISLKISKKIHQKTFHDEGLTA